MPKQVICFGDIKIQLAMAIIIGVGRKASLESKWYGVQWDITDPDYDISRIGSTLLHQTLPIHNKIKGCLLNDDGTVNYYLNPTDWTKKADGTASELTGVDGVVMIEIPKHYISFQQDGNIRRAMISEYALPNYTLVPKMYISAYEAALDRTNSKLTSVVNATAQYRGGDNNAAWDGAANSLLGKPATNISRTNFRTYARALGTGWEMYTYQAQKTLMWLFTIEYATRNSQKSVNSSLDANGFKQGGLGVGVTTVVSTEWNNFSSYYPFINCGASNSLANYSGELEVTLTDFGGTGVDRSVNVNRYRGVELPFGHIWKNCDGVLINIQADDAGGESQLYATDDPAKFSDDNYSEMELRGLLSRTSDYIENILLGDKGEILPYALQVSSVQYWCDRFYTSLPASGYSLRTLLCGGYAHYASAAGFGCSYSHRSPSSAAANVGSRLCFLGA